jgi:hypothetical protein
MWRRYCTLGRGLNFKMAKFRVAPRNAAVKELLLRGQ